MRKKRLIYLVSFLVVIILVVFIWLLVSFLSKKGIVDKVEGPVYPDISARDAADWSGLFLKEIEVEFMEEPEYKKMDLAQDPMYRIQVIKRNENGKVTAYKKVYSDEEIITHVYDPGM